VVHRDGRSKTTAGLEGFLRDSRNYIDDLEVRVQRRRTAGWKASLQHLRHAGVGTFSARLAWSQGTGAFGALPAPEALSSQGTSRMRLLTGQAQAVLPFGGEGTALQYSAQWQWQHAWTRLTPQDRFCIGGRSTVRGFDGKQSLCGDLGHLLRQEVSGALPWVRASPVTLRPYVALDAGRVRTSGAAGVMRLAGAVAGLRAQISHGQGRTIALEVFSGRPLSSPAGFAPARQVAGFSLRAEF
jgi:hemolysin activation/secretion protein